MREIITYSDFDKIIHSIEYSKTEMVHATNSVFIRLFDSSDEKIGYFMINPSWRIVSEVKSFNLLMYFHFIVIFKREKMTRNHRNFINGVQ